MLLEVRTTLRPNALVADVLATASQSDLAALLPAVPLKLNVHNQRRKQGNFPKLLKHRKDINIPANQLHTAKGDNFLLYDSGVSDQDRILMFGTADNLDILNNCKLWLLDGSFKTAPKLFYRVYTIHGLLQSEFTH